MLKIIISITILLYLIIQFWSAFSIYNGSATKKSIYRNIILTMLLFIIASVTTLLIIFK